MQPSSSTVNSERENLTQRVGDGQASYFPRAPWDAWSLVFSGVTCGSKRSPACIVGVFTLVAAAGMGHRNCTTKVGGNSVTQGNLYLSGEKQRLCCSGLSSVTHKEGRDDDQFCTSLLRLCGTWLLGLYQSGNLGEDILQDVVPI